MHKLRFSHVGLFVGDVQHMASFYRRVLGFVESDRGVLDGRGVIFLTRDPNEHHQLIFFSGLSETPREPVVNQLSFRLPDLESLIAFHADLGAADAVDVRPVDHGNAWSVYFRDPEGNRIEVYTCTPWYVSQPRRVPLDVRATPAAIRAETEAWCRLQPSFQSAADFARGIEAKLATHAIAFEAN
jgi:catechol 2,3-dioxygenase